jgi:hypothetical protein
LAISAEVELHQAQPRRVGWMTFSVADPDLPSERFLVTYCTECLAREFGGFLCWLPTARSA